MHATAEHLHLLINAVPLLLADIDADQRHRFHNVAYGAWYGETPTGICGMHLREVWGETYYQTICPHVEAALAGQQVTFETSLRHSDGQNRLLRSTYLPYTGGQRVEGFIAVIEDITERQQADQALRESEARFRIMADHAPVALWMSGTDAKCTFFNQGWLDFTGRSMEQEIGDGWAEGIHPLDLQHCIDTYIAAFNARCEFEMEYRIRRADGVYRWVLDRGVPRYMPDGSFAGYIGSCIDITERRSAQEELARTNADLRRSNQELEHFAYVASHDLKAPLHGIAQLVSWLKIDLPPDLDPDTQHKLTLLHRRVHRLETFLDDLLHYARVGRHPSPSQPVATRLMVHELVTLLSPPAGFTVTVADTLPTLVTAQEPLRQVLLNLLSNALKHHDRPVGHIEVTAQEQGADYVFAVRDDGPGIAPAFHGKVFQMFQTLKPRDEVEGSGIGLAIAKKVVEGQGGRIWVESEAGRRGTTMRFTWPKHWHGGHA
jgi:PAS domain S-box-containing protein